MTRLFISVTAIAGIISRFDLIKRLTSDPEIFNPRERGLR